MQDITRVVRANFINEEKGMNNFAGTSKEMKTKK